MDSFESNVEGHASPPSVEPPDVMNDPAYDTNTRGNGKSSDDADTCRICRGEGSKEEELFFPCKCSGSIKFVHQNCLMEWLSHSQKKHCELCKTPFRFTKLYDAHMPKTVPVPVFLRQASIHTWNSFLTWSRLHLVAFVWVFWLPWCMRAVWRGLFWIGDGGWVDWKKRGLQHAAASITHHNAASTILSTSPAFPTSREALASALVDQISEKLSKPWTSIKNLFISAQYEPLTLRLVKKLYYSSFKQGTTKPSFTSAANVTTRTDTIPRAPSWFSEVPFLTSMTRSTTLNNIIIDILEGQVITMFIVVAFILIFLIREWVMQQQQNLLMGPEGNQNAVAPANAPAPGQERPGPEPNENRLERDDQPPVGVDPPDNAARLPRPAARILARPRPRLQRRATLLEGHNSSQNNGGIAESNERNAMDVPQAERDSLDIATSSDTDTSQRPALLDRGVIARAVEIRRTIEEHPQLSPGRDGSGAQVFKDLWARANQNPSEVLKIIEKEDRAQELDWVVTFMRKLEGAPPVLRTFAAEEVERHRRNNAQIDDCNESSTPISTPIITPVSTPERENLNHSSFASSDSSEIPLLSRPANEAGDGQEHLKEDESMSGEPLSSTSTAPELSAEKNVRARIPEDVPTNPKQQTFAASVDLEAPLEVPDDNHDAAPSENLDSSSEPSLSSQPLLERLMDLMWGGVTLPEELVDVPAGDEERIVNDLADEAPFFPVPRRQPLPVPPPIEAPVPVQDPEVVAAAAQAGIDPNGAEALDDIEDLEGVMELIGMQGPLLGLIQNGIFCALLVSLTIATALWIPYMFGKVLLIMVDQPGHIVTQPLRFASTSADIVVDFSIFAIGCLFYWVDSLLSMLCAPVGWLVPPLKKLTQNKLLAETAKSHAERALERLAVASMSNSDFVGKAFDIPNFSVFAHESLYSLEGRGSAILEWAHQGCSQLFKAVREVQGIAGLCTSIGYATEATLWHVAKQVLKSLSFAPSLLQVNPLKISLTRYYRPNPLDYTLAAWNSKDRSIAIMCGYLFFALLGMLYLRLAAAIRGTNKKGRVESGLAEILYQAGGVMKVVLIISIEMIVFPLYCGLLLDVALLPLFGNASLLSRLQFTIASPNTSLFIHWFIGTCYMFHFALFVAMCRKIMRSGVLFFIRDPDDPTFHPVRDVLERSVSTQLWKISFSALVYGGLVLVCLGGVVWGVASSFDGIFPIQWSSTEPVLEFPVDLLFYNSLMPLAVKFFKPSTGLTKIYGWWFRKCARILRLTDFLFGEEQSDEQGRHVRRTWTDWLYRSKGDISKPAISDGEEITKQDRQLDIYFLRDGKFVQAPASDQVRIPKNQPTFIEVDPDDGEKLNLFPERNPELFTKVYIPPFFRLRIGVLILMIWLFAAGTGVSITVIPLVFGRYVFSKIMPSHVRMNDIYSFSLGIYVLGGTLYAGINIHRIRSYILTTLSPHTTTITSTIRQTGSLLLRILGLIYAYSALTILLPALVSLIIQCYLIIPLHTYLSAHYTLPNIDASTITETITTLPPHTTIPRPIIHLIQDWTLGILYIKVVARLVIWSAPSRPATALNAVIRNGYFNPDIALATRGFILPFTLFAGLLLALPLSLSWLTLKTLFSSNSDAAFRESVYRYSYPAIMAAVGILGLGLVLAKAFRTWRRKVRDEVYLIGERLHNYGEARRRKKSDKGKGKERVERPVLGRTATA